jgi:Tol biopolymer transport system component
MAMTPGSRLGAYEILSPIGAGGMGEVYRARDSRLKRDVAIKVLPESVAADPARLTRFEREAQAVAALSHANILSIFDFGREGAVVYAVTELLDGETLRDRLAAGPIEVGRAVDFAIQIARGLAAAHEKGILHRDLKPENVFVTKDGGIKILDFGLAKETAAPHPPGEASSLPTEAAAERALTEPGTVVGTIQYMAPEQIRGLALDHRADLFALGAVLYEMLSGRRAFRRATPADTTAAILSQEPPEMSTPSRAVPPALERLTRRCLEKRPEDRFQSARDVAFGLEVLSPSAGTGIELSIGAGAREAASPRRGRERLAWSLCAVLLAGLLAALLSPALRQRPAAATAAQKLRFAVPPPTGASIPGMLALSPDGRRLAFVATDSNGRDRVFVRDLDALESRALEGTEGAAYPFWSPDGHTLAFFARGKLKRIDTDGGAPQVLCDAPSPRGGSWGSRGTIVLSVNTGGEVHRVSEKGGESTALAPLVSKGRDSFRYPRFLPDGRHFLYQVLSGTEEGDGVYVASLDGEKTRRITRSDGEGVFAEPGLLLYRNGSRLLARRFDPDRQAFSGEAFAVLDDVRWDAVATIATAVSVSRTGLLAYQTGGAFLSRLLWYDRSGRELGSVGPDGAYWEPTLSPDGRWLAVPRIDPESARGSIWTIDLERGSLARLSSEAFVAATPLWSPDGRRIFYTSYGSPNVLVQDARGAAPETVSFRQPGFMPLDDFSRDGRFLFYEAFDIQRFHFDVWVRDMPAGTSRPLLQASFNQLGARLSPDGHWLAYESDESGISEIFVRSFPGAGERRQVSQGGGQQPKWRGDGKELFYVSPDRKVMSVEIRVKTTLEAGVPRPLFQTRILSLVEARNHYDVTSDGQRFLVNSRRPEDVALPILILSGWMPEGRD